MFKFEEQYFLSCGNWPFENGIVFCVRLELTFESLQSGDEKNIQLAASLYWSAICVWGEIQQIDITDLSRFDTSFFYFPIK
jgi:hypothetical protein